MYSPMSSLTDPPDSSPITHGIDWLQGAALGTAATIIAVIAVAAIGLMMLSGRLELRRGGVVVLGCFILFGAANIAAAITGLAGGRTQPAIAARPVERPISLPAPTQATSAYDPYAGASVPNAR